MLQSILLTNAFILLRNERNNSSAHRRSQTGVTQWLLCIAIQVAYYVRTLVARCLLHTLAAFETTQFSVYSSSDVSYNDDEFTMNCKQMKSRDT